MDPLLDALHASPLGRRLDRDELHDLASRGRVEHWSAGSLVMEEGLGGPRMVVILEGRAQVTKADPAGGEWDLAEVGPGDILGEMSILCQLPRTASVRAIESLRVFALDRVGFGEMIASGSSTGAKVSYALAQVLTRRLAATDAKVVEILARAATLEDPLREFDAFRHQRRIRWDLYASEE